MNGSAVEYQRGVGLIEVLVTLLVLSTSLMALGALQTRALAFNQGAYIRSQANIYAYDIFDRIRLNTLNLNSYTSPLPTADFNLASTVVTAPQAAADIDQWRRNIATTTPSGKGAIECVVATQVCTVTITWSELNNSGQAAEDTSTLVYTARL